MAQFPLHFYNLQNFPQEFIATEDNDDAEIEIDEIKYGDFFSIIQSEDDLAPTVNMFTSLLQAELSSLPRDVAHRATRASNQGKMSKEDKNRMNQIEKLFESVQSQNRNNPEVRSQLLFAKLSSDFASKNEISIISRIREFLTDCPFNQNNWSCIDYTFASWSKQMSLTFAQLVTNNKGYESAENLLKVVILIFDELSKASKGTPTSQIHSLVGLGALLYELYAYQQMHGYEQLIGDFLKNGIEIFLNLYFQQSNYTLSWSFYNSKEGKGKYAMSQLAIESIYSVTAYFLTDVISSLCDEAQVAQLVDHIVKIQDFEDQSPLGAYGIGALTVKLVTADSKNQDLKTKIEQALFTHGPMSSSNSTQFLLGGIENMDLIQWSDSLEKLKAADVIITEKLYFKFPSLFGDSSQEINLSSTAGILSPENIETWIENVTSDEAAPITSKIKSIEALGGILISSHAEKYKRSAFMALVNVIDEAEQRLLYSVIFQLAKYRVARREMNKTVSLPLNLDYLGSRSLLKKFVEFIQSNPKQDRLIHALEAMKSIRQKLPPLDLVNLLEHLLRKAYYSYS